MYIDDEGMAWGIPEWLVNTTSNIKETKMDIKSRLAQAEADRDSIQENINQLKKQIKDKGRVKVKFGDMLQTGSGSRYVVVYDPLVPDRLIAVGSNGMWAWGRDVTLDKYVNSDFYSHKVVGNIFD